MIWPAKFSCERECLVFHCACFEFLHGKELHQVEEGVSVLSNVEQKS